MLDQLEMLKSMLVDNQPTKILTLKAAITYLQVDQSSYSKYIDLQLAIIKSSGAWDALKYLIFSNENNHSQILTARYLFDIKMLQADQTELLELIYNTHGYLERPRNLRSDNNETFKQHIAMAHSEYKNATEKPLLLLAYKEVSLMKPVESGNYTVITTSDLFTPAGEDLQTLFDGEDICVH